MRSSSQRFSALFILAALSVAAPAAAHAATFTGVDASMSTVMQLQQSSFSGIGMRLRMQSDQFVENIEFLPNMEYWRNSSSIQTFGVSTTRKDATVGLDARYVFFSGGWEPYVGAGWALHFLSSKVNAPGIPHGEDSFAKGGLTGLIGVAFPLNTRIQNFFEAKYHHLSEHKQLKINWGISILLQSTPA